MSKHIQASQGDKTISRIQKMNPKSFSASMLSLTQDKDNSEMSSKWLLVLLRGSVGELEEWGF